MFPKIVVYKQIKIDPFRSQISTANAVDWFTEVENIVYALK